MTRGHGWALPFTVWRTSTSYSLPALTGAFYEGVSFFTAPRTSGGVSEAKELFKLIDEHQ